MGKINNSLKKYQFYHDFNTRIEDIYVVVYYINVKVVGE